MQLPNDIKQHILETILFDHHRVLLDTQQSIDYYESEEYQELIKNTKVYGKQEIEADNHRKQELLKTKIKVEAKLRFYERWMMDNMPAPAGSTPRAN